ncbi:phosphatidylinositol synthase 1 (CDP-alcohol phosphatidyltransferase1) [Cladophialophora chaetospira]|uniref:Phosphatidylinositol synthase 1 (CDP-alcohol phosphatidyltransferase1) n=1 Tax=Cladophialophora chaetospira TaxID=386627 RepID=A0AA39CDR4_9EURO|nr:phosphatidylinositol synthase 1 (CDP-alcohol phosphatidyltransferase1) [Cladophialophora chaetospira]
MARSNGVLKENGRAVTPVNSHKDPNGTIEKVKSIEEDIYEEENIFVFIPNIIGYVRIVTALASLYYMPLHPRTCSALYSFSCILDAADGLAARKYNQSTTFGAVLDMVTDRCTTSCLLVFLASAFPRWSIIFQGLISLDLASHYIHMYASLTTGGQSHKKVEASRSWVLHLYYTNKTVLFLFCALNELFFIALYLLSFSSPLLSPSLLVTTDKGGATSVQPGSPAHPKPSNIFINPWSAGAMEMARANKMDSTVPWILAGLSFPVMFGKQVINVIQLVKASKLLGEVDVKARRAAGITRKRKRA